MSIVQGAEVLRSLNGVVAISSGVAPGRNCERLTLTITSTGSTVTVVDLNGNSVSLGTVPAGFYQLDIQFQSVTFGTPANVTAAGFFAI